MWRRASFIEEVDRKDHELDWGCCGEHQGWSEITQRDIMAEQEALIYSWLCCLIAAWPRANNSPLPIPALLFLQLFREWGCHLQWACPEHSHPLIFILMLPRQLNPGVQSWVVLGFCCKKISMCKKIPWWEREFVQGIGLSSINMWLSPAPCVYPWFPCPPPNRLVIN